MIKEFIGIEEAKKIILETVRPVNEEIVSTKDSLHRHLCSDIISPYDMPFYDNAAMDGFAVNADDLKDASKENPITLKIIDKVFAGKQSTTPLRKGTCIRIFTGAQIPEGANAIVRQEVVTFDEEKAIFTAPVKVGDEIRQAGEDVKKGTLLFRRGDKITPAIIGHLSALNIAEVKVFRRPKVLILATGSELLELGSELKDGKIINSNSYALSAMVTENGGIPVYGGIVEDDEDSLIKIFNSIKEQDIDIVITTGGVSVGEYDLIKEVFGRCGVKWLFWKVRIRPGQPLAFGIYNNTLFFGLPGNPVSSMVTFDQFVRIAILKMMGVENPERLKCYAITTEDIKKKPGRTHYLRGILFFENGELYVNVFKNQSSGAISSISKANCYIILEENHTKIGKGEKVLVELFKM